MQKFNGKIARLEDVMTGFGAISNTVLTEEAFVNYLIDNPAWQTITQEVDGVSKPVGYFNKFWIEEIDGATYVFGEGFIYDDVDFKSLTLSNNFHLLNDKENK